MSIPLMYQRKSKQYQALEQELRKLRRFMLPRQFDPTGVYSDVVYTRALAYRILAHAEFESYFEDRVREVYLGAIHAWQNRGKMSKVIAAMLAFSGQMMEGPPDSRTPPQPSQKAGWDDKLKLANKVTKAGNALNRILTNNHGVREPNLLKMLLPVGIEDAAIDTTWLATIDSFGKDRGSAAHISERVWKGVYSEDRQEVPPV
jgi:hypothetical protein